MRKIFSITAVAAVSVLAFSAFGASKDKDPYAKNVETEANGDIVIKGLGIPDSVKDTASIGTSFVAFLSYVDPNLDFEALGKSIDKTVGDKKASKGGRPITAIMAGINKYLGRNNMNLQSVRFAGTSARQKLDVGLPIFCWIAASKSYNTTFKERSEKRAQVKSMDEWSKDLRKLEMRKIPHDSLTYSQAIVSGYNKTTGEYKVLGVASVPVWLTEKELKELILDAYILRF